MSIDLQRFCAISDDDRAYLNAPWPHKGWMYASNGHIIVRVPAPDHAATVAAHDIAERAAGIFAKCEAEGHAPLPLRLDLGQKCTVCRGTGHVYTVACKECEGGEFEHGSHTYTCQECDGTGRAESTRAAGEKTTCNGCRGKGYFGYTRVPVGDKGAGYDAVYLSWIRALPNALFAPGEAEKAAHFKFDGGEGCLMPMWEN